MTTLILPAGLPASAVAALEELASERLRSVIKFPAEHDDGLTPAEWQARLQVRVDALSAEPADDITRQFILELAAVAVGFIEAFDRRAHRAFINAR